MIWGLTTPTFTLLHVIISMLAIAYGFAVLLGMIKSRYYPRITAVFLFMTALTSITGFAFPNAHITPAVKLGIISMVILVITVPALYVFRLSGAWRPVYVAGATMALYFNFFVLVVQSFQKVPALRALAPHGTGPAFAIAQGLALLAFIALGIAAVRNFKTQGPVAKLAAA
jgi:hypothetical protein